MGFFVGTDVGGTFTDLWVSSSTGQTCVFKAPTTADILGGVIDAMRMAALSHGMPFEQFCTQIQRFGHATTVGLNALLTGKAARTAILTTLGFGDTLEIGRMRRQTSGMNEIEFTDAFLRNRFPPLVDRDLIVEIEERIDARGAVIVALNEEQSRKALRELKVRSVEAVAICTLWSTQNPVHENRLRELTAQELPGVFISVSHEISPSVGEYARLSTTAANAALGPVAGRYLLRLEETLRESGMSVPVLMMTCAGGVLPTAALNERPVVAIFSGPAAGVIGSRAMGERIGVGNVLTIDIGGTSFDVGVVTNGKPIMRSDIAVAGAEIHVHSIDVDSIGAGGGSIASVQFGELRVGPESAGANPGPACYGRGGTKPTATDADLVLGVLDPKTFLGGRMELNLAAARQAIQDHVAGPLGTSVLEGAWAIREVLDNRMADLLRRVTIERGYDPRDFVLFANGGAGPSHAWVLSAELGLPGFVVPAAATAQSAYGTANSDLVFAVGRPVYVRISPGNTPSDEQLAQISAALRAARAQAAKNLNDAFANDSVTLELLISIRYRGQPHHLDVVVLSEIFGHNAFRDAVLRFEGQYEALFGHGAAFSQAGYEIIAVRAIGVAELPPPASATKGEPLTLVNTRPVVFQDPKAPVETNIYQTTFPEAGAVADGPCIIEFPGQSVVVPPDARATADDFGNLHVRRLE